MKLMNNVSPNFRGKAQLSLRVYNQNRGEKLQ